MQQNTDFYNIHSLVEKGESENSSPKMTQGDQTLPQSFFSLNRKHNLHTIQLQQRQKQKEPLILHL